MAESVTSWLTGCTSLVSYLSLSPVPRLLPPPSPSPARLRRGSTCPLCWRLVCWKEKEADSGCPSVWGYIAPDLSFGAGKSLQELCVEVVPALMVHVCLLHLLLSPSGSVWGRRPQKRRRGFPFYHWLCIFELQARWRMAHSWRGYLFPFLQPSSLCPRLQRMRTRRKMKKKKKRTRRKNRCHYRCRYYCYCCCYRCYYCCCSLSFSQPVSPFHHASPSSEGFSSSPAFRSFLVFRSCLSPQVWIHLAYFLQTI